MKGLTAIGNEVLEMKNEMEKWTLELEGKDDFDKAMERIYAWYEGYVIDRPPLAFRANSAPVLYTLENKTTNWRDIWFDAEAVVQRYIKSIENKKFLAETFPIFWPNLGPSVYAAFYGCQLTYGEITSWSEPCVHSEEDVSKLKFDSNNVYFKKIKELTECALHYCSGRFMVGYTDIHIGMDCVADWRDSANLCMDMYDNPEMLKKMLKISLDDFHTIFDGFDKILKAHNQLSVTWLEVPSFGKMHIPSCDFGALISQEQYIEYGLPILQQEVKGMTHNVFHLDGPRVANHLDAILSVPEINAIQWIQPPAEGFPIMQWKNLLKRIQKSGKSIYVFMTKEELDDFMDTFNPEGVFLNIASDDEAEQRAIIKKIEKW